MIEKSEVEKCKSRRTRETGWKGITQRAMLLRKRRQKRMQNTRDTALTSGPRRISILPTELRVSWNEYCCTQFEEYA